MKITENREESYRKSSPKQKIWNPDEPKTPDDMIPP